MKRASRFLALVAAATALAGCPGRTPERAKPTPSARPAAAGDRVSVLLITIDTLRADHMGSYGYRRPTTPAHGRLRPARRRLRAGLHLLAQDPRQLRRDHDRPLRVADRLRQEPPPPPRLQPDAGQRPEGRGLRDGGHRGQPQRRRVARLREGLRPLPRDVGGEVARHGDGPHARDHRGRGPLPRRGEARPPVLPLAALREPARALRAARALGHGVPRRRSARGARPCARWTAFTAGSRGSGRSRARASAGTSRSTTARSPRWTPRSGSCSRRSTARRSATAPWS